ncbi:MAG: histone deacetylase family protein, partial [Candidatus Saccharibacteria bacterium]|nr:histone deacetylase family protein [Pseudorhodobacter sp.]
MLVFSHEAAGRHLTPPGHPERVERLAAVERGLANLAEAGLAVERRVSPLAEDVDLLRCHPAAYLARIRAAGPAQGTAQLDADTWMSAGSF